MSKVAFRSERRSPAVSRTLAALALWVLNSCDPAVLPPTNWEHGAEARTIWRVNVPAAGQVSLDAETVYFPGSRGVLFAIERSNGRLKWTAKTNPNGAESFGLGTAVAGNTVAMLDFNLHGFDRQSGQKLWTFAGTGSFSLASSNPVSDGTRFFMGSGDGIVYAVSPQDGAIVWQTDRPMAYHMVALTPKVHGDLLLVPYHEWTEDGRGAIAALDAVTGTVRWLHEFKQYVEPDQNAASFGHVDADDERVYASFGPGDLIALNRATGNVEWYRSANVGSLRGGVRRPLAVVNGILVVGHLYGQVEGISPNSGVTVWTRQLAAGSISYQFAHDSEHVYVTPTGRLAAINVLTGQTTWSHGFKDDDEFLALNGPGAIGDSSLYIAGAAGLFAFRR